MKTTARSHLTFGDLVAAVSSFSRNSREAMLAIADLSAALVNFMLAGLMFELLQEKAGEPIFRQSIDETQTESAVADARYNALSRATP